MRIVIVGVCASGKSALANRLTACGYEAHVCAQEHSFAPAMWRMTEPDVLVYLDASLVTVRKRKGVDWGDDQLAEQRARLADARAHCHLYLNTEGLTEEKVFRRVRRFLDKLRG